MSMPNEGLCPRTTGDENGSVCNIADGCVVDQSGYRRGDGRCGACRSVRDFPRFEAASGLHPALSRSRKALGVLAVLLGLFVFVSPSFATTWVYPAFNGGLGNSPQMGSGSAFCAWGLAQRVAQGVTGETLTSITGAGPGAPTAVGVTAVCNTNQTVFGSSNAVVGSMSCSTTSGTLDLLMTIGGASGYTSGGGICYNGCEYLNGNSTVQVITAKNRIAGSALPSGIACGLPGSNASDAVATNNNCVNNAGTTACAVGASNTAVVQPSGAGTFSVVAPNFPTTPQTCIQYADGGAACNGGTTGSVATPPGPSTSASATTAAVPTAQVVQSSVSSNVVNYYSAATVAASKGAVLGNSSSTGTPQGSTLGTGSGSGSSGTGPGDCMLVPGEAGADDPSGCNGTTPSLTRADTVQSNIQDFYTGLQSAPIVSSLSAVASGFPSAGSCPTANITLVVFGSHTYDLMSAACSIWAGSAATVSSIFNVIWCLMGIMIVMSA